MSIVVSDTSPIRALDHLNLLNLFPDLFGHVYIPAAVARELERPSSSLVRVDLSRLTFASIRTPTDAARLAKLRESLDTGESEAICLAEELHADVLVIDEARGRAEAARRGIRVIGAIGILVQAKIEGRIPQVAPLLDLLANDLGFYISAALRARALRDAGE